jgi:uncharacterized OB-fold protein
VTAHPAIEGWFRVDPPALLGRRCVACGNVAFPPTRLFCGNPACASTEFEPVELSTAGIVWSFTVTRYQPPPPYLPRREPFEPFALAAVGLAAERLIVLGQVADGFGVDDLRVGDTVDLVIEPLYEDVDGDALIWRWRPRVDRRSPADTRGRT